ncbi:MAG: polysaccharide deacetylase family protein [Deltaproteobacteria bacterium]|nr:polysaccharide deacetylase family protein [Deltaproteobacteria bacterium]
MGLDGIFSSERGRRVHCAVNLDTKTDLSLETIDAALDRARDRGEIVELYAHSPGRTVKPEVIEHVLAGAAERGLAPVTYADFANGEARAPGLALSFDDSSVRAWSDTLPLFARYGARVTFFISRYEIFYDEEKALVTGLAAAGHDIEPHSVNHENAPEYVEKHGLGAYLRDDVWPSIDALEADGHPVHAFAYPFGARTTEIDDAIRQRVPVLRSVEFSYSGIVSPCPE